MSTESGTDSKKAENSSIWLLDFQICAIGNMVTDHKKAGNSSIWLLDVQTIAIGNVSTDT